MRTATVRLVWGQGRATRAPELVLQCLTDPAKSDPASAVAVETIVSVLRGVVGNPVRYQLLMDIVTSKRVRPRALRSNHPTARFLAALKSLGVELSSEGLLSHPAFPDISLSKVNVKEAVPYLRDAVRYNLTKTLAIRSRKVNPRSGRTARSDFQDLPFAVDWESTLSLLREKRNEEKGTGVSEDQSKALTVILTGSQRSMERLFRHKQPVHPGLPAPASAACPFCDMGVPETPKHIFWECEAHSAAHAKCGTEQLLKDWNVLAQGNDWMESFDFPDHLLCNGIVQEDPFLLLWKKSLPGESSDTLELPPWDPGPSPILVDGRVCLATDGSTQNPTERRLRYSGVGITGSPGSSWSYHAPLGGPTQQNDKAELVAAVLAVEAVAHQSSAFPDGVLLYIGNDWVCTNVARVAKGWRPPNSFAHIWWWRRLEVAISLLPPNAVAAQWVPSHKDFTDVARGTLTADQLRLNSAADSLAEAGRNANAPNPTFQKAMLARKNIIRKIQLTLIEVHLSRKALEASLIAAMVVTDSVIPLGLPPVQEACLLSVRDRVPSYCWASGSGVAVVPGLSSRLFHADLPGDTRTGKAAVAAAKWYFGALRWPAVPSALNRGATWIEITLDFIASTNVRLIGSSHNHKTSLLLASKALRAVVTKLQLAGAGPLSPFEEIDRCTALLPFGAGRQGWHGFRVAPSFFRQEVWTPLLWEFAQAHVDSSAALNSCPVGRVRSPNTVSSPRPFFPLGAAFARLLPPAGAV